MVMFKNGELEEFLLFECNFHLSLDVSGTIKMGVKIHYLCTLLCGEYPSGFETHFAEIG